MRTEARECGFAVKRVRIFPVKLPDLSSICPERRDAVIKHIVPVAFARYAVYPVVKRQIYAVFGRYLAVCHLYTTDRSARIDTEQELTLVKRDRRIVGYSILIGVSVHKYLIVASSDILYTEINAVHGDPVGRFGCQRNSFRDPIIIHVYDPQGTVTDRYFLVIPRNIYIGPARVIKVR